MKAYGNWLVIAAAVCWGTTGTAQALAPEGSQPAVIGSIRLLLGSAFLLLFAWWRGAFRDRAAWPALATLIAAGSMAAYQICFFAGVAKTGVAVGTMVGIGSSPILAGVIGYLARGEKLSRKWGLATGLAIAGCSLLLAAGSSIQVDAIGVLLAIGAGASYAIFTVASKRLLEGKPPEAVMAVTFCLGALILLPFLFTNNLDWLKQPRGWAVAIHLGLVTVAVGYSLFARGLSMVPVATAATLTLAEPMTAGLLGVFLLGEHLTLPALGGIGLIFAGLVLLTAGDPGKSSNLHAGRSQSSGSGSPR